jgi:parallel beta-helix repeat protein
MGSFAPDVDSWVDEREWPTKIVVYNTNSGITMKIDNPGGTVELANLSIESGSEYVIVIGDGPWPSAPRDACKDLMIRNCKIVGTYGRADCVATWGGLTGIFNLEGNHIAGYWCVSDGAFWSGFPSGCRWEVYSNAIVATQTCMDLTSSEGIRIENNHCEGPVILYSPSTRGEIILRDNKMIQFGHNIYHGNNAFGIAVSHEAGFKGGEISGNTIEMNPTENIQLTPSSAISLATYEVLEGAHGLLVQDNTISGKADFGIALDNGASDNIIRRNNLVDFTANLFGPWGAAQILLDQSHNNLLTRNMIGSLDPEAFGGIVCRGTENDIIRNDFTCSNIAGLTAGDQPCVILGAASKKNLVFEPYCLFPGMVDATEQVLDIPREPTRRGVEGTTTNIIVGYSEGLLAEDINPGVGQRVQNALAILD